MKKPITPERPTVKMRISRPVARTLTGFTPNTVPGYSPNIVLPSGRVKPGRGRMLPGILK